MRRTPVIPRERAARDAEEAVDHSLAEGSLEAALGFVDALEAAYELLARHPGAGSPRFAQELGLPGLRSWRLSGSPHVVFYQEREGHVDVWRVLHEKRDIPVELLADE